MSFTEKKFSKLNKTNKIKKIYYAINEYLNLSGNISYIQNLLIWLNKYEGYNFQIPHDDYSWGILSQKLMQILKIENPFIEKNPIDNFSQSRETIPVAIILENVRSPFNTGAIMRSCDAFGVESVHLCGITPNPKVNKKVIKTIKNARIDYYIHKNTQICIEKLNQEKRFFYAIEKTNNSSDLSLANIDFPCALIFGNEEFGVDIETLKKCNSVFHIAMKGTKNSINVSVAAGISIFHVNNFYQFALNDKKSPN